MAGVGLLHSVTSQAGPMAAMLLQLTCSAVEVWNLCHRSNYIGRLSLHIRLLLVQLRLHNNGTKKTGMIIAPLPAVPETTLASGCKDASPPRLFELVDCSC